MAIRSLFQSRSFRRVVALLVSESIILATLPAGAENEPSSAALPSDEPASVDALLSLVMPNEDATVEPAPSVMNADVPSVDVPTVDVPSVVVRLEIVNTLEVTTVNLPLDGKLGPDDARKIASLLRCRRTGRLGQIAPGVLAMLAHVATQWPDRPIQIVSGFRAPPFGAPQSKHFKGHAIDFRVPGVRTTRLRDFVWREHHEVGVGFYAKENFIHMDWRPGERDRAWTGTEEAGSEEYNPRWARKARRTPPSPGTMVASAGGLVDTVR